MAKKNKRIAVSGRDAQNNSKLAGELAERLTAKAPSSINRVTEFNPDYTHIKRDLRRIAVLAGSFFAILIALWFYIK